jgi:hypothetical protein
VFVDKRKGLNESQGGLISAPGLEFDGTSPDLNFSVDMIAF